MKLVCVPTARTIHIGAPVRTNIEIDDALLDEAMSMTGLKTKRGAIEEALKRLVANERRRRALQELDGIGWEGDLDAMREGWSHE